MDLNIPKIQQAAVVTKSGKDWDIVIDPNYPVPVLGPGQALVRLTCSGVCHSDLSGINGSWNRHITCDVPGHEGIGRIVGYHPDVDLSGVPPVGSKVGVPLIRRPCGECEPCSLPDGEVLCPQTTFHGLQSNGTYQQYTAVYSSYLVPVPASLSDVQAAPVLCGGVTAYKALRKSGARAGNWVVIAGAGGGLGSFSVQYAVAMGMRVVGIDAGDKKRAQTLALGADAFLDYLVEPDIPQAIRTLTGGGAHAILVLAPTEKTYNQALEYVRCQGCIVCVGLPHEGVRIHVSPNQAMHQDISIKGSVVGTRKDIAEALEYVVQGRVKPDTHTYPLGEIKDIFQRMERNEVLGRAVLLLGDD